VSTSMLNFIMAPVISLFLNISIQIISYKYILKRRLLFSEYIGCACGLIILATLHFGTSSLMEEKLSLFIVNLIIYGCFSYAYFTFINMGETARRIRILRELYSSGTGLTKEEIVEHYSSRDIISVRINRLLSNKQIKLCEGRYYLDSPLMLFISKVIVYMKLVILGKKSEFDR